RSRPLVAAAGGPGELYVWEVPADGDEDGEGDPLHDPLTGHEGAVLAMDTALVGDRLLAVTGGEDETVRLWDLSAGEAVGAPLTGHHSRVEALRTARLDGREVALSGGRDGVIRVWDLAAALS
ncbi:hypothetical protein P8605_42825, partial [Streptomyces sp. T-3]|nr:hypothetical protein [Streptomyces sp. T-3]